MGFGVFPSLRFRCSSGCGQAKASEPQRPGFLQVGASGAFLFFYWCVTLRQLPTNDHFPGVCPAAASRQASAAVLGSVTAGTGIRINLWCWAAFFFPLQDGIDGG